MIYLMKTVGKNNVFGSNSGTIDKAVKEESERTSYANVVRGKANQNVRSRIRNTSGMREPMKSARGNEGNDKDRKIVFDRLG